MAPLRREQAIARMAVSFVNTSRAHRSRTARAPLAHRSQVPRRWTDQALPIGEEEVIAPRQVMVAS